MGGGSYSSDVYRSISDSFVNTDRADIFKSRKLDKSMSPKGVLFREARDSVEHPETVPIIIGLDVTGSMGIIPEQLCKGKLGTLIETMLKHNVAHPAVMFTAIGDHYFDNAPLQIGQYESGTEQLVQWLTTVFLESGGGGQDMESYMLAWLFAARHTSIDHFEVRNKKGYLFTIGDERVHPVVEGKFLKELMGYEKAEDITSEELLKEAQRMYEVFHIHANSTGYRNNPSVIGSWKDLLGERALVLDDHEMVAELISSQVSIMEGANIADVVKDFDASTADAITKALAPVKPGAVTNSKTTGAVEL